VELACSTTLSVAYKPQLLDALIPPRSDGGKRNIVFIVCGGFKINLDNMAEYEKEVEAQLERDPAGKWDIVCDDGRIVNIDYTV